MCLPLFFLSGCSRCYLLRRRRCAMIGSLLSGRNDAAELFIEVADLAQLRVDNGGARGESAQQVVFFGGDRLQCLLAVRYLAIQRLNVAQTGIELALQVVAFSDGLVKRGFKFVVLLFEFVQLGGARFQLGLQLSLIHI